MENDTRSRFITTLLNQLQELYFKSPKESGVARLNPSEAQHVRETLKRAEQKVQELACVTAAMAQALDDARRAFGCEQPRTFTIPTPIPHPPPVAPGPPPEPTPTPEPAPEPTPEPLRAAAPQPDRNPTRPKRPGA